MAKPIRDLKLRTMIVFVKVVGWLGVMAWVGFIGLSVHYNYTRPTSPQPSQERIYSLNEHGHIAYLTHSEQQNLNLLFWSAVVLIAAAFVVGTIAKRRQRRLQQT